MTNPVVFPVMARCVPRPEYGEVSTMTSQPVQFANREAAEIAFLVAANIHADPEEMEATRAAIAGRNRGAGFVRSIEGGNLVASRLNQLNRERGVKGGGYHTFVRKDGGWSWSPGRSSVFLADVSTTVVLRISFHGQVGMPPMGAEECDYYGVGERGRVLGVKEAARAHLDAAMAAIMLDIAPTDAQTTP